MSGYFQSILEWIFSWVGNYGWAVVVFTLAVRLVLLPLDIKSKKSMRAMSKVQPKVQALQAKYGNDREKLNLKLNELYRKEKVSPMAGCLPMLISLPVLWWMFGAMRNLANEQTIQMILSIMETGEVPAMEGWLWIKNVFQPDSFMSTIMPTVNSLKTIVEVKGSEILTQANIDLCKEYLASAEYAAIAAQYGADQFIRLQLSLVFFNPVITLPKSFSALFNYANGLFILPVLAALSQFFMTKLTGTTQPAQNNNQSQQEQEVSNAMNSGFMKWFFPLFSLWICAGYNAAFAVYWVTSNLIAMAQNFLINKYLDHKDAIAAASPVSEDQSGKGVK